MSFFACAANVAAHVGVREFARLLPGLSYLLLLRVVVESGLHVLTLPRLAPALSVC